MYSSKDGLAWKLPVDKFIYLNNHFATWPEEDKALFRKKGYFHYCYVDSHTKYTGGGLPARDKWTPRRVCYETIRQNCAQYLTARKISGDAFFRRCKADLHLLTNRELLDMTENLTKWVIPIVFENFCQNQLDKNYDPKQPSTFLFMIGTNKLYGGIMEKFSSSLWLSRV